MGAIDALGVPMTKTPMGRANRCHVSEAESIDALTKLHKRLGYAGDSVTTAMLAARSRWSATYVGRIMVLAGFELVKDGGVRGLSPDYWQRRPIEP